MAVQSFRIERPGFLLHVIERDGNLTAGLFIVRSDVLITFQSLNHLAEFTYAVCEKARNADSDSIRSESFDIFHIKQPESKFLIECFVRASFQVTLMAEEFQHLTELLQDLGTQVPLPWRPQTVLR